MNASGYGISGSFEHQTEEDGAGMIHLNCEALTRITYLVLPYLRRGSFIYQMASSAGFAPQPNFTVYAATKAYVKSFSIALRQELSYQGIRVIAVCPGPVKTEFFDRGKSTLRRGRFVSAIMQSLTKKLPLTNSSGLFAAAALDDGACIF